MAKKRVFVSFDFDNDKYLKDLFVGQALLPDSPFELTDTSLKEAAPMSTWEEKARASIARSDLVVIMLGNATHRAPGVLKEVGMAASLGRKLVQIRVGDTNPTPVTGGGPVYPWNWTYLTALLG